MFSSIKDGLKLVLSEHFEIIWFGKLTRESAMRGTGLNKLQTYRKYKQSILTEPYVIAPLSKCQRSALVKIRCGDAALKIGTPEQERLCTLCNLHEVESEDHCLIRCELYPDIRQTLFHTVFLINPDCDHFKDTDKLCFILSNEKIIPNTAKAYHDILTKRFAIIYHS